MHPEANPPHVASKKAAKPHRTVTGRVVYNRKMHVFSFSDWARIGRKIPPPQTLEDAIKALMLVGDFWRDLTSYLFGWMPGYKISQLVVSTLRDVFRAALEEYRRWLESGSPAEQNVDKILSIIDGI